MADRLLLPLGAEWVCVCDGTAIHAAPLSAALARIRVPRSRRRRTHDTACGRTRGRLYAAELFDAGTDTPAGWQVMAWPPPATYDGHTRCGDCWQATGRPAPDRVFRQLRPAQVTPDISNEQWIKWARPVWDGIVEMDTLNPAPGSVAADERHICPLQLGLIERAVHLWSNPGELVCSPFAGIGSEGFVSVRTGRRFVGCELKMSYWATAIGNLRRAEAEANTGSLFDPPPVDPAPEQAPA